MLQFEGKATTIRIDWARAHRALGSGRPEPGSRLLETSIHVILTPVFYLYLDTSRECSQVLSNMNVFLRYR